MIRQDDHGRWSNAAEDVVAVEPYDPRWPRRFADEERAIRAALGPAVPVGIEHFGSTAVPGLAAKPIVDIMLLAPRRDWPRIISTLEQLDYVHWKENPEPDREFLVKGMPPYGTRRTHHVHLCEQGSRIWERLAFRDHLREHAGARDAYARLKAALAEAHREDREAYTRGKARFVAQIMDQALEVLREGEGSGEQQ